MIHHAVIQVCLIKLIAYFMNKVSITRKCHSHNLQTHPWLREEGLKNDNSDMIFRTQ